MVMNRISLIMLVSQDKGDKIAASLPDDCEMHPYDDIRDAVKTLQNIRYDLVMLDDNLFKDKTLSLVSELKRRYPYIPLVVLTESNDAAYQDKLTQSGADDCVTERLPKKQFQFHINMLLKQHDHNQALVNLNHNLHLMASLSQLLYSTSDSYTLILQAIKFIRAAFQLYGMAFILREGDVFRMYAGGEEVVSKNKLYESIIRPEEFDPYLWTVRNRSIQIYKDIAQSHNYRPIPILNKAESVAIIPLNYQYETLGAMGIYALPGQVLTHEDVIVYERYGAQLISALQNASQHREQRVNIQSSQQLLRAWQLFSRLHTPAEIAERLCNLLEEVPRVAHAFVWLNESSSGNHGEILADTKNRQVVSQFEPLRKRGMVGAVVQSFTEEMQPQIIEIDTAQDAALAALARLMPLHRIVALPIASSGELVGGVLVGISDEINIGAEELNQMTGLSVIAGQALERIILTSAVTERNNRLEAILRTISEGIFFVDENEKVVFCNPQVTELTKISAQKLLMQDVDLLINEFAGVTANPATTLAQLQAGKAAVSSVDYRSGDYPIAELAFPGQERNITLEFVRMEGLNSRRMGWAGVMRSEVSPTGNTNRFQSQMITHAADSLRVDYTQIRSLIGTLSEQHGRFGYRERDQLLRQIEESFERFGGLWSNFLDIQSLESGNIQLQRDNANIYDLMTRIVNSRQISKYQRQVKVEMSPSLPMLKIDEFRIEQALTDALLFVIASSSDRSDIAAKVEQADQDVMIAINSAVSNVQSDQTERVFDPYFVTEGRTIRGLYTAREIVRRHGGHTWAETANHAMTLKVSLPTMASLTKPPENKLPLPTVDTSILLTEPPSPRTPTRAPSRSLTTIMMIEGSSTLARVVEGKLLEQKYDVLPYRYGEEALEDLNSVRIDLVVIDVTVDDMDGLELCKRIRQRSEVPIILVSDRASDNERVQGLNAGGDEYLTRPISDDEIMARLQVIFKRKDLPDRMSEPLAIGDLYIDFARRQVFIANKPVELTRIEYDLLYHLVINKGQVLTHKQLLEKVWGPDYAGETHYLWVNISRLRKKLESRQPGVQYIHTQQGIGYYFDA